MKLLAIVILSLASLPQVSPKPDLKETTQWIVNFSFIHGHGKADMILKTQKGNHFVADNGCSVSLVSYTRNLQSGDTIGATATESFSLSDIAPERIKVKEESEVNFEVYNLSPKIDLTVVSSDKEKQTFKKMDSSLIMDSKESANRIAAALKNAVELCGGQPALF